MGAPGLAVFETWVLVVQATITGCPTQRAFRCVGETNSESESFKRRIASLSVARNRRTRIRKIKSRLQPATRYHFSGGTMHRIAVFAVVVLLSTACFAQEADKVWSQEQA